MRVLLLHDEISYSVIPVLTSMSRLLVTLLISTFLPRHHFHRIMLTSLLSLKVTQSMFSTLCFFTIPRCLYAVASKRVQFHKVSMADVSRGPDNDWNS
ncbi:hypothetical protein DFH05DRAFT_1254345 [Lentinula detonsa]|uniref:Uncharacterized protein n=1 Tax=Lentinula detonsa TaxID=2804962 RepID=A0A9W8NXB6_9AGAR|nr:hypothetical protein DFH05DRAFT_1254345 [Lentinula detonsa]